jgi:hypothetical protein
LVLKSFNERPADRMLLPHGMALCVRMDDANRNADE